MEKNIKLGLTVGVSLLLTLVATPTAWTNNVVAYENHAAVADVDTTAPCNLAVTWTLADGESIKGLVNVSQGLTTATDTVTSVDTFGMPIQGVITLGAGSTLTLPSGLHLGPTASLVIGSDEDDDAVALVSTGEGSVIYLGGDLTIPSARTLSINGNATIDGGGHTLTFGDVDTTFYIEEGSTLTLRNMTLEGLIDWLSPFSGPGTVTLKNCILNLAPGGVVDVGRDNGSMLIKGDVIMRNSGNLSFWGTGGITIDAHSTLMLDDNVILQYRSAPVNNLVFTDMTSVLHMRNSALVGEDPGLSLTKGTIIIDGNVDFINMGNEFRLFGIEECEIG